MSLDWTGADLHIDWLTVSQAHAQAPDWGAARRLDTRPGSGELLREWVVGDQVKGSWESSCWLRSSGGRVEWSGNPSKWGRLDAVGDGCRSIFEAIRVASGICQAEGLPPFAFPDRLYLAHRGRTERQGPRVSRVDIAGCLMLGGADEAAAYMRWVGTQRVGKRGLLMAAKEEGQSYKGGSARRRQLVMYLKGPEVAKEAQNWQRKRTGQNEEAVEYLRTLAKRARDGGWVRREVRLGHDYLTETGLCWAEEWGSETMVIEFGKYRLGSELSEAGAVLDWKGEGLKRLVSLGLSQRAASLRLHVFMSWMSGIAVADTMSERSFRRYAADLSAAFGVDIRSPSNVVSLGAAAQRLSRPVAARFATREDYRELYRGLREVV